MVAKTEVNVNSCSSQQIVLWHRTEDADGRPPSPLAKRCCVAVVFAIVPVALFWSVVKRFHKFNFMARESMALFVKCALPLIGHFGENSKLTNFKLECGFECTT